MGLSPCVFVRLRCETHLFPRSLVCQLLHQGLERERFIELEGALANPNPWFIVEDPEF